MSHNPAATATRAAPPRAIGETGWVIPWRALIGATILVILFVPLRRYTLSGGGGFELEPYRLVVAAVLLAWGSALLVDPRVRLRTSGLEAPLLLFAFSALVSIILNKDRVDALAIGPEVTKKLIFFASFIFIFFMIVSVIRTFSDVERIAKVMVAGGAIVAMATLFEYRTGHNFFDDLPRVFPFLKRIVYLDGGPPDRGGLMRATGSAEHPIALGAGLALLIPLAAYLVVRTGKRRWWGAVALLTFGTFATLSRTSLIMLVVVALTFLWLRPRQTLRLWPAVLPILAVAYIAVPGALGTFKYWIVTPDAVVAEQKRGVGGSGQGRIADIGPALDEWSRNPLFGEGFGTRISGGTNAAANAQILDDQWLKTLLETGLVGWLSLMWLFIAFIKRTSRHAKRDDSPRGWFYTAATAAVFAYGVSMFTFDSLGFTQVTFLLFVVIGLACALMRSESADDDRPVPA